jgi:penicillin-binding protein 2
VVAGLAVALVVAMLGLRLFQLQVVQGAEYRELARQQRTSLQAIRVARGLIYDRRGRQLVENVPYFVVRILPADLPFSQRDAVIDRLSRLLKVRSARIYRALDTSTGDRFEPVLVAERVPKEVALVIAEEHQRLPGVYVEIESRRHYLDDQLVSHILGWTGRISGEDYRRLRDEGYLLDDTIGRAGVEATFEKELRGTYGVQEVQRDSAGRVLQVLRTVVDPVPGRSIELTIDTKIQKTAEKALRWAMRLVGLKRGVFIVMNPQTGEVLAMVSLPNYDNNLFAKGIGQREYRKLLRDPAKPLLDFAINEQFQPGSTYKLVTGSGALQDGKLSPTERLRTAAYIRIGGWKFWDWNKAGFGYIDIYDGFAHSSDTFFFQVALRLGIDRLAYWAHQYGFGSPTGIDLPGEVSGLVPTNAWARRVYHRSIYPGEVAQAGIGQGYDMVTPLQLITAYNAMFNGGTLYRPQIVRRILSADGKVVRGFKPDVVRRIPISAENLRVMRVAARNVLVSRHTYNFVDVPIVVAGKSGTAEYGIRDSQGRLPYHSWFVGFVPKNPRRTSSDPYGFDAVRRTDSQLSFLAFAFDSRTAGNAATEIVKYFIQLYFHTGDYRIRWLLERANFYGQ